MNFCWITVLYNAAYDENGTATVGITMLMKSISDKSQLKGNIEQIGFQIALKTSKTALYLPSPLTI